MSWPIRFLTTPPLHSLAPENGSVYYDGTLDFEKFAIGDLAFYHYRGAPCRDPDMLAKLHLTAHYFARNAQRPPLVLALPDYARPNAKLYFLVDGKCYSNTCTRCGRGVYTNKCTCPDPQTPKGYYDGWTVAGEPPLITVSPSVNYDDAERGVRHYHGFIQNGVVGDG